ncbi:MAG: pseudouridine synthase, partial [Xanthobacteraceae bacterium]
MDGNGEQHKSGERIAKVIARAGLASRREAEEWVTAGRVAVNGAVMTKPAFNVTAQDRISVDGEPLRQPERTRLFLYHKPRGLLTTHADPRGRPNIFAKLPAHLPRLISVGRLDFNTEGLLLLTNDGALARVLELPSTGWLRRYRVRAHGSVAQGELDALHAGITISGVHYGTIEAAVDRVQGSNLWLTFAIREGKNREVRNVLNHLGLTVTRLIRVSFGPFRLGELAERAVEEVRTRTLREQLGDKLIALAGADFSSPIVPSAPAATPEPREARRAERPTGAIDKREKRQSPDRVRRPHDSAGAPTGPIGKSKKRQSLDHAWRSHDSDRPTKKLHRKYRGAQRETERREAPAGEMRTARLQDRKGREVAVERWGHKPAPERSEAPVGKQRTGRLQDRKGREVTVERWG